MEEHDFEFDSSEWVGWEYPERGATTNFSPIGYLPGTLIPPLTVIAISVVLFFTLSNITVAYTAALPMVEEKPPDPQIDTGESPAELPISENPSEYNGILAPLLTPEVRFWESEILAWSIEWGLDPNLVATVMQIESCGDPGARSSAGAIGLFQVMPFHFIPGEDGYHPPTNARRGLAYLQQALLARGGEVSLGLAGYNAGINGARRPESNWPRETQRYVRWGSQIYADASLGNDWSASLQDWLSSGGAGLCARARQRLGFNQ